MPLQQINWLQIDTQNVPLNSSGSASLVVLGGTGSNYLEAVYAKNLYASGSLVVGGDLDIPGNLVVSGNLTVKGTTTAVESNVVTIGDNIVELNGTAASFGGLLIKDPTAPNTISGSFLWDSLNDRWIAGPLGSEQPVLLGGTGTANYLLKTGQDGTLIDSRVSDDGTTILMSGSVRILGDLKVEGGTTLVQTDHNKDTLTVSGAMAIVKNIVNSHMVSASLTIENLGSLSDRNKNSVIDCGDGFF
jgi:cytoskeletal protein CcmA (bactofilin family)